MSIAKITFKTQVAKHVKIAAAYAKVATDVHIAACEDLQHAAMHGDVSLCKDLYDKLGGAVSPARTATLKAWFVLMSGNQMTAEKGEWKLKKGWTAEKFSLDKAEETPYWTLAGEVEPKAMSLEVFLKTLESYTKKIDKAVEEDRFNGDPVVVKGLVNAVIDFTKERAKRLTAQEAGTLSNKADAILKEGEKAPVASKVKTGEVKLAANG